MVMRKIIEIDTDKCNGCGNCIPNCPEGAIQMIDNKARLVSDLFCDGLGACLGTCPQNAITVIKRDAEEYDEVKVMKNIVKQGKNTIIAHLKHLKDHNQTEYFSQATEYLTSQNIIIPNLNFADNHNKICSCLGATTKEINTNKIKNNDASLSTNKNKKGNSKLPEIDSKLTNWPIQLSLLPPNAPYLKGSELVIAADCSGFSFAGFNPEFIEGKVLTIGCPKLDDLDHYIEKLTDIFRNAQLKSITIVTMKVPCCNGLYHAALEAFENSKKETPLDWVIIGLDGKIIKQ